MKIYFTVTGTSFRYGTDFLEKGTKVTLVKEPDNKFEINYKTIASKNIY